MIRRNDLVKQFDLIVKQEIQNHNNAVLSMNIAFEKLRYDLDALSQRIDKKISEIESKDLLNHLFYEKEKTLINEKIVNLTDCIKKFTNEQKKDFVELKSSLDKFTVKFVSENDFNTQTNEFRIKVKELENKIKDNLNCYDTQMGIVISKTNDLIKNLREEILNKPSEAKAVKEELNKRLDMEKVDNLGIKREIDVLKKTALVHEKNLENIYTVIDKLKVSKAVLP